MYLASHTHTHSLSNENVCTHTCEFLCNCDCAHLGVDIFNGLVRFQHIYGFFFIFIFFSLLLKICNTIQRFCPQGILLIYACVRDFWTNPNLNNSFEWKKHGGDVCKLEDKLLVYFTFFVSLNFLVIWKREKILKYFQY